MKRSWNPCGIYGNATRHEYYQVNIPLPKENTERASNGFRVWSYGIKSYYIKELLSMFAFVSALWEAYVFTLKPFFWFFPLRTLGFVVP